MKDYNRLTYRVGAVVETNWKQGKILERLAELEDKLESGELGNVKQAVKEFAEMLEESYESLLSVEFEGKTEQQIYQRAGMEQGLKWAIEILKELCGADEKEQEE